MNGKLARCVVMTVVLVFVAAPAFASEWSPTLGTLRVVLPYGAAYPGGTHRGVDLAASSGAEANSPVGGTVAFAGSVPADGGGTCFAVTVLTGDGLKVTLLPLQSAFVSSGATVSAGEAVGLVAEAGDNSTAEPHVHLSVRRGDAYLDPTTFLPSTAQAITQPAVAAEPSAAAEGPHGAGPAAISVASAPAAAPAALAATPVAHGAGTSTQATPSAAASAEPSRQLMEGAEVRPTSALRPDIHFSRTPVPLNLAVGSPALGGAAAAALALVGIAVAVRTRQATEQVQ